MAHMKTINITVSNTRTICSVSNELYIFDRHENFIYFGNSEHKI